MCVSVEYDSDYGESPRIQHDRFPARAHNSVPVSRSEGSLFNRVAPPASLRQTIKPPLSPKQYGGKRKPRDTGGGSVRIEIHSQRRGELIIGQNYLYETKIEG